MSKEIIQTCSPCDMLFEIDQANDSIFFFFLGLFRRKTNRTDATINATTTDQLRVY